MKPFPALAPLPLGEIMRYSYIDRIYPVQGKGFMSSLAAAGYLLFILSAVARTGINPVPTADVCNTLAINRLSRRLQHSTPVGVGFIPTLVIAGYLLFILSAVVRTGINPIPRQCDDHS